MRKYFKKRSRRSGKFKKRKSFRKRKMRSRRKKFTFKVKRVLKNIAEIKYTSYSTAFEGYNLMNLVHMSGIILALEGIVKGTDPNQRVGDKITIKKIIFHVMVYKETNGALI